MSMEAVSKWLGHSSVEQTGGRLRLFLDVKHLHDAVGINAGRAMETKSRHTRLLETREIVERPDTKAVAVDDLE